MTMQALPGSTLEVIEAKFFFQLLDSPDALSMTSALSGPAALLKCVTPYVMRVTVRIIH
jgi:hypothetical protein